MRLRGRRVSVAASDAAPSHYEPPRLLFVIPVLGITQILAWGSSYYLPAVLAKPIAADTGWPLTWIVGGLSLGLLIAGLISPRVGREIHRRGGRPVLAASAVLLGAGLLGLAVAPATAAEKDDRSCIDAAAKENQKFSATMLKELGKCREKPSDPSTAQCDENLPKIVKAAQKRDNAVAKKCKKLDPARAFGYAGCQVPGCESADASAAGYQACVACATRTWCTSSRRPTGRF